MCQDKDRLIYLHGMVESFIMLSKYVTSYQNLEKLKKLHNSCLQEIDEINKRINIKEFKTKEIMETEKKYTAAELKKMLADQEKEEKKALRIKQKEYVNQKEAFINKTIATFCDVAGTLKQLKSETIINGNELHLKMYEIFDKKEKNQKSFSLISEDGYHKVEISTHDFQTFNEQSEVHINSIKEILEEKFSSRNKSVYSILDDIMMKNKKGDYDETLVVKLNKHRDTVNDERFNFALDELAKCFQTYNSATYVRAYKKNTANQWKAINIQFSSL